MSDQYVIFDAPGPKTRRNFVIINIVAIIAVIGIVAWVLWAMAGKGQLEADKWKPFLTSDVWIYYILPGLRATLIAAVVSLLLAGAFGLIFGIGRLSINVPVRWVSTGLVEFFRAVPVLLVMIFSYQVFSIYKVFERDYLSLAAVVTGLTVYNGAVVAELVRSGVHSLPKGQNEAGLAIGLTRMQVLKSILLPQGLMAMFPALISQFVVVLKDSALGYMVLYPELLRQAERISAKFSNAIPSFIVVALIFIVLNYLLTFAAQRLARRLRGRSSTVLRGQMITAGPPHVAIYPPDEELSAAEAEVEATVRPPEPWHR